VPWCRGRGRLVGWSTTTRWESPVEKAIREAQERGEFDDLPGAGTPLTNLGDPDGRMWWLRPSAEREHLDLTRALPTG
jgi:hypothetical protein